MLAQILSNTTAVPWLCRKRGIQGIMWSHLLIYMLWIVLATVPGSPAAVRRLNRTRWSSPGCYPETGVPTVFGDGLELDRGSILWFLQLWLQLSIWVLIVSRHDQFADREVLAPLSPPAVRFAIGPKFIESLWKKVIFLPKSAGFQ